MNKINLIDRLPLAFYRLMIRRKTIGLYYHVVSDQSLPHIRNLYSYKNPASFENDILFIKKHFNPISYEQLTNHYQGGGNLKYNSVILTFDDGFKECFSIVRPLLLKYSVPCIFFVTTKYIDNRDMADDLKYSLCIDRVKSQDSTFSALLIQKINTEFNEAIINNNNLYSWIRKSIAEGSNAYNLLCQLLEINPKNYLAEVKPYLTLEQINTLNKDGFTIGSHSKTHSRLNKFNNSEIERIIDQSCQSIQKFTHKAKVPFAFPYSADGVSRDFLQEFLDKSEHVGLLFNSKGIRKDKKFIINRICGDSPQNSTTKNSNLPRLIKKAYLEELSRMVNN